MNLKSLLSIFMGITLIFSAVSCSDVHFSNAPSAECAAADNCLATPSGETMTKIINVPYANKKVDLLFVVDNSRTMIEEQDAIASRLAGFLTILNNAGIDWRIAITTTDTKPDKKTPNFDPRLDLYSPQDYRNGRLVPFLKSSNASDYAKNGNNNIYYITKNTSNYSSLFYNTIRRPESAWCDKNPSVCPSVITGDERGILSAINNVKNNSHGFIRSEAQLHVVVISDEDERSNGGMGLDGIDKIPYPYAIEAGNDRPEDLLNELEKLNKRTKVHSIVKLPAGFNQNDYNNFNFQTCLNNHGHSGDEFVGCHYLKASIQSGGIVGNKDGDYTQILSAIAKDIDNTTISRQDFSCVPSTIEARPVDSKPYPKNFSKPVQILSSYGTKYVEFNPALQEGVSISLTWTCPRK